MASTKTSPPTSARPAEGGERTVVSCKAPEEFSKRTGITEIETVLLTYFEDGFDEKTKKAFRYPANETLVSARALAGNGRSLELPGLSDGSGSSNGFCSTYKFLLAGNFGVITHLLGYGAGPYPFEENWIVHIPTFKLVKTLGFRDHGFLSQDGPDCFGSSARGDSGNPGDEDRWCATEDGERFKWVSRVMVLDAANRGAKVKAGELGSTEYYWFQCDRSSGLGKTSRKEHVIQLGKYETVTDPDISARMDKECELWATEASSK